MQKHVKAISARLVREFVSLWFPMKLILFLGNEIKKNKKPPNFLSLETLNTQNRDN